MKYRFKWNDEQIFLVLNRISDDRDSLHDSALFHCELSDDEDAILRWSPESDPIQVTELIQQLCTEQYIATLRALVRTTKFNKKLHSSATIRLSSASFSTLHILSEFDECQNLSRSDIIERALNHYWDTLRNNSVVTTK